jgi:hypothetical protein
VVIDFGVISVSAARVGGLHGARGTTTATATTCLRVVAMCGGLVWRTCSWTQGVRSSACELWLFVGGWLTGCAEPRFGGVRVVARRVVLARVALQ